MDVGPLLPLDLDHPDARNVRIASIILPKEAFAKRVSRLDGNSATKPNAGNVDLNIFSIGNVPPNAPNKRIAHLLVGLLLIGE